MVSIFCLFVTPISLFSNTINSKWKIKALKVMQFNDDETIFRKSSKAGFFSFIAKIDKTLFHLTKTM